MSKLNRTELLTLFPADRNPFTHPAAGDVFTTPQEIIIIKNRMTNRKGELLLVVFEHIDSNRILTVQGWLPQPWRKFCKGKVSCIHYAEDDFNEELRQLYFGEVEELEI